MQPLSFFVSTLPGLDDLLGAELQELGIATSPEADAYPEKGGVLCLGGYREVYRANLRLRCANRILLRLGSFYTNGFPELVRKVARMPWEQYLRSGEALTLRVSSHKSRLNHTGAIGERVAIGIGKRLGKEPQILKAAEAAESVQIVTVRFLHNHCTVSVDSSGAGLHRRGYRQELGKAPLRETLAAGLLLGTPWRGGETLLDPFCGSGTIAIEAALLAQGMAPGRQRRFRFMDWPGYDDALWKELLAEPPVAVDPQPKIIAADRDAGVIAAAQANAARAGVADAIEFHERAISNTIFPTTTGWVITNPPYGARLNKGGDLRDLYARLGQLLKKQPGWRLAMLCGDRKLPGYTELGLKSGAVLDNGGLPVRIYS